MSALVFDLTLPKAPLTEFSLGAKSSFVCPCSHALFVVNDDNEIIRLENDELRRYAYEWKSKLFYTPKPMVFNSVQVIADWGDGSALTDIASDSAQYAVSNATLWADGAYAAGWNDVLVNEYEFNGSEMQGAVSDDATYLFVDVYAENELKFSVNATSNRVYRIPGGYLSNKWSVGVRGNLPVRRITLATSTGEIASK